MSNRDLCLLRLAPMLQLCTQNQVRGVDNAIPLRVAAAEPVFGPPEHGPCKHLLAAFYHN